MYLKKGKKTPKTGKIHGEYMGNTLKKNY